ncbi:DUF4342 domain-containing protein [Saccharothrix variisporea]|uniref:Uncharacterized protein DUF4342 n=1 Tax=Saccharothrix variisporea TaxID=543527 RepID=A0A495XNM0_9PSEU|nr:DUF4342 domain-containing protein [Saccharothrix variisporea]RKT74504.1 uncharacterized protein DUF4342 [Saccharothrix variisporea]
MSQQVEQRMVHRVRGEALVAKVKELLHEGTVRRLVIKDAKGHTVMEIPVTAGVVAAIVAPVVTAVAAVAALAGDWTIEVEHREPPASEG